MVQATKGASTVQTNGRSISLVWLEKDEVAYAMFKVSELEEMTFISTYSYHDPASPAPRNHGYQRDPMDARFKQIGDYFSAHPTLVTPIITSARLTEQDDIREFEALLRDGKLAEVESHFSNKVVSVIDGQHRRGGLAIERARSIEAGEEEFDPLVPVMIYFGLEYSSEAEFFDTINTTQRKLPRALIEVTKGDITERNSTSHAQQIREITFALARDKDSVWEGEVNMTGARDPDRKVTYEGLRRSTSNMFTAEVMSRLIAQGLDPEKTAKSFWDLVKQASGKAWTGEIRIEKDDNGDDVEVEVAYRLKELVGVASIARVGKDIITSALEVLRLVPNSKDKTATMYDAMTTLVSKLTEVDWEKRDSNPWVRSQAGFAGQKELYTMLHDLVYNDQRPGEGD